jgi:hypothetical protein
MMERRLLRQHLQFTMLSVISSSYRVSPLRQTRLCLLNLYYQVYIALISLFVTYEYRDIAPMF